MSLEAMQQKGQGLHATENKAQKNPTNADDMQHAFTSLQLSKPRLFPPTQPTTHRLPFKPTFTVQAVVHSRKESILNPTGLALLL